MAPFSRRHFLIAAGLSAPALRLLAQDPYAEDVILRAMKDELERSRQLRVVGGGGDEMPYFISYTLDDADAFEVNANLGALTSVSRNRFRLPNIEVRVGSYDFDSTGHIYSGIYTGSRYDTEPFPLDDNYRAMRENLWLGTDHAYKAAVESIARKRASLTNAAAPAEKLADFSRPSRPESSQSHSHQVRRGCLEGPHRQAFGDFRRLSGGAGIRRRIPFQSGHLLLSEYRRHRAALSGRRRLDLCARRRSGAGRNGAARRSRDARP